MRQAFRFKQFNVLDDGCAMMLGTDSVLLGSWVDPGNAATILDIGTGCGVLALMMAQKSQAIITGLEIHKESANVAGKNFKNSPWGSRLSIIEGSFQQFVIETKQSFDLIITNPPYFIDSLKAPSRERSLSRHTDSLSHNELLDGVVKCLNEEGFFALILPCELEEIFTCKAFRKGLFVQRVLHIKSKPALGIIRSCMIFGRKKVDIEEEEIIIRTANGSFTTEYQILTNDFYL